MSFETAIRTVFRKYAVFEGRASRAEFWWYILFLLLVIVALKALDFTTPGGEVKIGSSLMGVWYVATFLPTVAVTVRRLRDAGRDWMPLLWLLVPFVGVFILAVYLSELSVGKRKRKS